MNSDCMLDKMAKMNSWNLTCKKEKDELVAKEEEKCIEQIEQVEDNLTSRHKDKVATEQTKSSAMITSLKAMLNEQCESELAEAQDQLTQKLNGEKDEMESELKKKHKQALDDLETKLKQDCANEKADFK